MTFLETLSSIFILTVIFTDISDKIITIDT